jgi:hypothetical protein
MVSNFGITLIERIVYTLTIVSLVGQMTLVLNCALVDITTMYVGGGTIDHNCYAWQ